MYFHVYAILFYLFADEFANEMYTHKVTFINVSLGKV